MDKLENISNIKYNERTNSINKSELIFLGKKMKNSSIMSEKERLEKNLLSTIIQGEILEKQETCNFNNYSKTTQLLTSKDNWTKKLLTHFYERSLNTPRLISTPQFKHTNNKLEILVYVYNHKKNLNKTKKVNILKYKSQKLKRLVTLLEKIYNKSVVIRQINLKSPQLNVEIFIKYLVRLSSVKKRSILSVYNKYIKKSFRTYYVLKNEINKKEINKKRLNFFNKNQLYIELLSLLSYGHNIGIKIETAGRSSKRRKATRSRNMIRTKGSLKNCYSSKGNMRVIPLSGYMPLGLEKAELLTKTKNGCYNHKLSIASF